MSEDQHRAQSASSPDGSDDIEVTTEEPQLTPAAARRARRAKAKLALRIPDDEVLRPQEKAREEQKSEPPRDESNGSDAVAIQPHRIISIGPPPPDDTMRRFPTEPPSHVEAPRETPADDEEDVKTPMLPAVSAKTELDSDETDIPVDEEEPEFRPKMSTIPSNPPPPPDLTAKMKAPSSEELEIDDVEAASVLSRRPPPPAPAKPSSVPPTARTPTVSKPPLPQAVAPPTPPTPPIPVDALSSTPQLEDRPTRARATALLDEEETRGIEEIEPDRSSAPPSVDSGDEVSSVDVVAVAAKPEARISTPPKPAPPVPQKMISIVAPIAAAAASPLAPPPLTEGLVPRRRARPWWEELFNDDFIRTMPKFTDAQVAAEVDFIEDSLGVAKGGAMLDLGCGTGRHAIELTRRGYSVVGFDLSLALLARAGEEAQEQNQKINFVQGDMREMTFEESFDGIYCWGSTFGFFEEEKNAHVITRAHKALRHGGQLLLDVSSRDYIIKQSPSLAWFEGEGCVCMDEMQVDWITSRMRVKRTMMLDDGRSKEVEYSIRVYSLHELGKMLHECGFRVAEVSGRIQTPGVFFGPESPRTLILAEKR